MPALQILVKLNMLRVSGEKSIEFASLKRHKKLIPVSSHSLN